MSQSPPLVTALLDAPLPASGIGWLDTLREENRQAFAASGLPDTRVEAWKYTALRALAQRRFAPGDADAQARPVDASRFALPGVDGPRLVFVNGAFRADLSAIDTLPHGLVLQPLSQVLQEDAEWLRLALSRSSSIPTRRHDASEAFTRINAASAADGVVLRVAAGEKVAAPVQLVFLVAAIDRAAASDHPEALDVAWHARVFIELGERAELSLVEHHAGTGASSHLATLVSDIDLHEGARLHHTVVQDADIASTLIRRSRFRVQAKAHATVHAIELGGALVRHDLQADLIGDEAQIDTRGVFMPHGRQHIDTQMAIHHQARDTRSSSLWRGVAGDRARGVFRGAIVVAPGADGSDASLSNKNLLLSPNAEIDTKPELEIHADEVKAAHGATVGQLDERSLFYLRSRGIPLNDARALLTSAFCRTVLDDLSNTALHEHLAERLVAQLPNR